MKWGIYWVGRKWFFDSEGWLMNGPPKNTIFSTKEEAQAYITKRMFYDTVPMLLEPQTVMEV